MSDARSLSVFAPAKINLHLHVTGRLDNGYHTLDSLVSFADIGDLVRFDDADSFSFSVTGPYAVGFSAAERDSGPNSSNIVVKAIGALSRAVQRTPQFKITLEKNMPLAAGIGGGSADAAAAIWGAMEWWGLSPHAAPFLNDLMAALGADVPACLTCAPVLMSGVGDVLGPAPLLPEVPVVLINPGKPCSTALVFKNFSAPFSKDADIPGDLSDVDDLSWFIEREGNDLLAVATVEVPEIKAVIDALQAQAGCVVASMSGSGATCFGLFREEAEATAAVQALSSLNQTWWVRAGMLNRPERY